MIANKVGGAGQEFTNHNAVVAKSLTASCLTPRQLRLRDKLTPSEINQPQASEQKQTNF